MFGKARAKNWSAAHHALAREYQIPNPISEPPKTPETRETLDQFSSRYKNMPANLGVEHHIAYAFLNAYTGNAFSNFHPTLLFAPKLSEDAIKLKEIREAHNRGKEAAKRDRISPGLETIARQ